MVTFIYTHTHIYEYVYIYIYSYCSEGINQKTELAGQLTKLPPASRSSTEVTLLRKSFDMLLLALGNDREAVPRTSGVSGPWVGLRGLGIHQGISGWNGRKRCGNTRFLSQNVIICTTQQID